MNTVKTCRDNCGTYRAAVTEGRCFKDKFCAKQERCHGRLHDCTVGMFIFKNSSKNHFSHLPQ